MLFVILFIMKLNIWLLILLYHVDPFEIKQIKTWKVRTRSSKIKLICIFIECTLFYNKIHFVFNFSLNKAYYLFRIFKFINRTQFDFQIIKILIIVCLKCISKIKNNKENKIFIDQLILQYFVFKLKFSYR